MLHSKPCACSRRSSGSFLEAPPETLLENYSITKLENYKFRCIQYISAAATLSSDYNPLPPGDLAPLPLPPPPARVPAENPPWSLWDVVTIALVAFGGMSIFGLIAGFIAMRVFKLPMQGLERNPKLAVPAEFLAYVVTFAFMVAIVRSRGLHFWRTIRWRRTSGILGYALLGFLLSIAVGLATSLLPIPKQLPIEQYFADTLGTWLLAIFGVTIAPLMEELFFRGFLYPALARPLGITWSIVITSLLFALIHSAQLANAWAPLLLLFIVGVVLTSVRVRTGSVVPGFFLHAAYNFTLFAELFFQTGHFRHFDKLGG